MVKCFHSRSLGILLTGHFWHFSTGGNNTRTLRNSRVRNLQWKFQFSHRSGKQAGGFSGRRLLSQEVKNEEARPL